MTGFRKTKISLLAILLFSSFFIFSGNASAATYYVSPTGSDSSSGSSSAPFRTIQKAADIVNPGDTVIVKDGIYTNYQTRGDGSKVFAQFDRGGTSANWITFKSENKWGAKFNGQNNTVTYGFIFNTAYIRMEDFEIYGAHYGAIWINYGSAGNPHDIYIYGNKIHDIGRECCVGACQDPSVAPAGGSGIYAGVPNSNITVDSNMIYDIGRYNHVQCGIPYSSHNYSHDHGIYSRSDNLVVINNVMWNTDAGFDVASCGANPTIVNNTFYGYSANRQDVTVGGHIYFTQNYDSQAHGTITVANNISYDPDYYMIFFYYIPSATATNVKNNLVYGTGYKGKNNAVLYGYYPRTPYNLTSTGNLVGSTSAYDPKFVNLSGRDFHLQSTSPAIDKCKSELSPILDHDRKPRSRDGHCDIGAYEH